MRSVNSRSIGSWWVDKTFNASGLPSASRTVNPSARSVFTQINIVDGSSSTTKIVFARDERIGAGVSVKTSRLGQLLDCLSRPSCPYVDDALRLYRSEP